MAPDTNLQPRQIWADPTSTSTSLPRHCTPVRLPSGGFLAIGEGNTITLTQEAVFQPLCTSNPEFNVTPPSLDSAVFDAKDPFYASTLPQMYAIAAVTVVSYLLVIIIFITPRTFFVGGSGGGGGFLGQRGMISGASGSTSVIGVGGRPWLQKVAALTVAISLTIASVDTFQEAERQYDSDYSDAKALTNEVTNSLELQIVRVVSDTFLWLAQAQTLIRLFPRHKEKVIIKWAGFVLIALDTVFSILNNFVSGSSRNAPRRYQDAVPALSYLFTFCLSLIYAAWIIYYSLSKRRYAFVHPKMRNICLVALLSYVAILIPVVFFILDISIYDVAGWGNYVRWVGAAAASVVVWEWVERIEALERDERKDGILGREIFDGDEMLEVTPSSAVTWSNTRRFSGGGREQKTASTGYRGISSIARRLGRRQASRQGNRRTSRPPSSHLVNEYFMTGVGHQNSIESQQGRLPPIASTMTTNTSDIERSMPQGDSHPNIIVPPSQQQSESSSSRDPDKPDTPKPQSENPTVTSTVVQTLRDIAQKIPIPFVNRHMSPPIEVKQAVVHSSRQPQPTAPPPHASSGEAPLARITAPSFLDRLGLKKTAAAPKAPLPVTVVPAPPRNTTSWTEVRFHGGSQPLSARPLSQDTSGQTMRNNIPLDQVSRRSTPIAGSASNRYSSARFQLQRISRGMSPKMAGPSGPDRDDVEATTNAESSHRQWLSSTTSDVSPTDPLRDGASQHGSSSPHNSPPAR
ncbi:MAG: hypothetical protein Q9218_004198 [Villophora microphyllina]